ncbi:SUMF1/EgtB/PvdO family nonheme iron enzyme [Lysobacter sp. A3-1-A15]|uniref:SUMF1/EgtB/PvdO family nonheme iron enzyme n=1 Tax=Novilysobacter viscosus TaxID=3098602 RepID=UPI002EDA9240
MHRPRTAIAWTVLALAVLTVGCGRGDDASGSDPASPATSQPTARAPIVTVSADQAVSPVAPWSLPAVPVEDAAFARLKAQAAEALESGRLFDDARSAIPLYVALTRHAPDDAEAKAGLQQALSALVARGDAALAEIDRNPAALRVAHEVGAVVRAVAPEGAPSEAYLSRLETVDEAQRANRLGEEALNAGRVGENGEHGALALFRQALELRPGDVRAMQGIAASESALIRRAEVAAGEDDFDGAERWLQAAAEVRPGFETVDHARQRIARQRAARIGDLRDQGLAALGEPGGLGEARTHLAELLRIARPGDPAAAQLRERIDLAAHYGLFRPGQAFTDALRNGGRGPELVVVPHGAFRMGAGDAERDATDAERPTRNIRFPRGLAVARHEVTVDEFGRFVAASGYEPRATRRGYSIAYDERSGNLVRRSNVDWRSDYTGKRADPSMPVVHVSAQDALAYAEWLSAQTGQRYRLPSEAEFEYALRAGSPARYPWGNGGPPARAGNFTGGGERSPSGREWRNSFEGYDDDAWGPAPVESYRPNAFGLHDMAGNVSEWVADCWHDNYRRAPDDGQAWVNPGCRTRVVRGGSWASSPAHTRSAWRVASQSDTTNARIGFRVVREI